MFIGSISGELRQILYGMAKNWIDKPVYIGCSGNFTVERVLLSAGVKRVYGCDVSLYTSTVGEYLAGRENEVWIQREDMMWLEEYMKGPLATIATILLCSAYFEFLDRDTSYHKRMANHYVNNFKEMHAKSLEKVTNALEGYKISDYYPMDVMDFARDIVPDKGAVFISFPPTYKGGYERLYKKIDEVFGWNKPTYELFDDSQFEEFTQKMQSKEHWVTLRDHDVPEMQEYLRAVIQTSPRSKPVSVFSDQGDTRVVFPHQKVEQLRIPRIGREPVPEDSKLTFVKISQGQMNLLRSLYLSKKIAPASASINIAVCLGGKLIGACGFSQGSFDKTTVYAMSDFAITPTPYKRASKLVLAVALSREMQIFLQNKLNTKINKVFTTAFTEKASSMKYRGLFTVFNKKDGMINYEAPAGKWTLEEGLQWWMGKHSKH